jgi:hypothetical protein
MYSIDDDNELSNSMDDDDIEHEDEDFLEWMIFGESHKTDESHETHNNKESVHAASDNPSEGADIGVAAEEQGGLLDGLYWDTTFKIHDLPAGREPTKGCFVNAQYKYLFKTPIDSFFAVIPYIFEQIFCNKINRYASDYSKKENTRQICGYVQKPVTINELLTYFGMLVFSILYPQTGHKLILRHHIWEWGDTLK